MSKLSYRPDIDGLRALAVIPVILFHLGFSWMAGGYLGVDVFFVISGFLITYIILDEVDAGTFSFRGFLKRRVSRILPALLTTIIATLIFSLWLAFAPDLRKIGIEALSATFSCANLSMLLKDRSYWSQAAESSPFLHTWSLSVEEQFYLIYPAMLFFSSKNATRQNGGRKRIVNKTAIAIVSLFFVSAILFVCGLSQYPISTFYALPTRIWELTAGGLVSLPMRKKTLDPSTSLQPSKVFQSSNLLQPSRWVAQYALFVGLVLIGLSYFQQANTGAVSGIVLLPVVGTVLILYFGQADLWVTRFLSQPALVFVGKLSYAAYLVHWPVVVLMHTYDIKTGTQTSVYFLLLLMLVTALLLHFCVERTTRKAKHIYPLVLSLLLVVIGLSSYLIGVSAHRSYSNNFAPPTFYGLYYDVSATIGPISQDNQLLVKGVVAPVRAAKYAEAYRQNGIVGGRSSSQYPEVLVIGDSHGSMWAKTIEDVAEESKFSVSFFTTVSNNPLFDIPLTEKPVATRRFSREEKRVFNHNILQKIELWRPKIVIVSMRWVGSGPRDMARIESLIQYCQARGVKIVLMEQPPEIMIGNHNSAQFLSYLGISSAKDKGNQYVGRSTAFDVVTSNQRLKALTQKHSSAYLFETFAAFSQGTDVLVTVGDEILYFDDDHLSYEGTSLLKQELKRAIAQL